MVYALQVVLHSKNSNRWGKGRGKGYSYLDGLDCERVPETYLNPSNHNYPGVPLCSHFINTLNNDPTLPYHSQNHKRPTLLEIAPRSGSDCGRLRMNEGPFCGSPFGRGAPRSV